jgi:hypothetical protein
MTRAPAIDIVTAMNSPALFGVSDDVCNAAALAMVLASAGPDWSVPGAAYLAIARPFHHSDK